MTTDEQDYNATRAILEDAGKQFLLFRFVSQTHLGFLWKASRQDTTYAQSETNRPTVVSSLHENAEPRTSQDLVKFAIQAI